MPLGLTRDQRDVLLIIQEMVEETGTPPTVRELAAEMEIGVSSAHHYLVALKTRGHIDFRPGSARSVVVLHPIEPPPDHYAPFLWMRSDATSFDRLATACEGLMP